MKNFVHLAAPAAALIGVLISACGSYLLALHYHRFKPRHFWQSIIRLVLYVFSGQFSRAKTKVRVEAQIGQKQQESRYHSLAGIYLLFAGFVLQAIGAIFWLIDSCLDILKSS